MILGAVGENFIRCVTTFFFCCGGHHNGEKAQAVRPRGWVNLFVAGVTILLSQTVFSLLVAHVLTQSSEAVPLIG